MREQQETRSFGGQNRFPGFYRGVVEYVNDPLMQNRVKVRVPFIHKDKVATSTEGLPWALLLSFGGGGQFGTIEVPPVGSTVVVGFEHGDPSYPMVFGSWYGVPDEAQNMGRVNDLPKGKISMSSGPSSPWHTLPGPEIPEDAQRRGNLSPENYVAKTPKGHTIIREDRDEAEYFAVIDRAGQSFLLEAEVLEGENDNNAARRGLSRADEGDALDRSKLLGSTARIEITDASGNRVRLFAREGSERISLVSTLKDSPSEVSVELNAADGTLEIRSLTAEGETRIGIDGVSGAAYLRAGAGPELRVDASGVTVSGDLTVLGQIK